MNNEHYGNQNSKRFMIFVIVVLFIGGFIKGMTKSKNTQTVTTEHMTIKLIDDWSLVKYDKEEDVVYLNDADGSATITYGVISCFDGDSIEEETIGDYAITGASGENGFSINLENGKDMILFEYTGSETIKDSNIRKLIQNIEVK